MKCFLQSKCTFKNVVFFTIVFQECLKILRKFCRVSLPPRKLNRDLDCGSVRLEIWPNLTSAVQNSQLSQRLCKKANWMLYLSIEWTCKEQTGAWKKGSDSLEWSCTTVKTGLTTAKLDWLIHFLGWAANQRISRPLAECPSSSRFF